MSMENQFANNIGILAKIAHGVVMPLSKLVERIQERRHDKNNV